MRERRRGAEHREKREDLAFIIPAFGVVLLMPLVANLFFGREIVAGVPLEIAYLFVVWLLLVAGAVGLASWLPAAEPAAGGMEDESDGSDPTGHP